MIHQLWMIITRGWIVNVLLQNFYDFFMDLPIKVAVSQTTVEVPKDVLSPLHPHIPIRLNSLILPWSLRFATQIDHRRSWSDLPLHMWEVLSSEEKQRSQESTFGYDCSLFQKPNDTYCFHNGIKSKRKFIFLLFNPGFSVVMKNTQPTRYFWMVVMMVAWCFSYYVNGLTNGYISPYLFP